VDPGHGGEQLTGRCDVAPPPPVVADAHRPALPPAVQLLPFLLAEVGLAADTEDLLDSAIGEDLGCRVDEPPERTNGLISARRGQLRARDGVDASHRGVPAVMRRAPRPRPRQRRRRSGDHRPCRSEGQALQDPAAEPDLLAPWSAESRVQGGPGLPRPAGLSYARQSVTLRPDRGALLLYTEEQGEGQALSCRQVAEPVGARGFNLVGRRPAERELCSPDGGRQRWTRGGPDRRRAPEVTSGAERAPCCELPLDDGEAAHEHVRGPPAEVMPPLALRHEKRVCQHGPAGRRLERRLQHQGVLDVLPGRLADAGGAELPVARHRVEQRAEHASRVEARRAHPGDAAVTVHQRRRLAVGHERQARDLGRPGTAHVKRIPRRAARKSDQR